MQVWLPQSQRPPRRTDVEQELRQLLAEVAAESGAAITADFVPIRDAFWLDQQDPFVAAFQQAYQATAGRPLPVGAKPFCDDGNSFWSLARIPAITHGPLAGGAHTHNEWVSIDDLVRVAHVYALTAVAYCGSEGGTAHA